MTLEEILSHFDNPSTKGFDEHDISTELNKLIIDNVEPGFELFSELMAFSFAEDYANKNNSWGTYFGPMMVWNNEDGTTTETPSIKKITPEMIHYWEHRSARSTNPILIARYAGLVWDFQKKISNTNPSHEICRLYIQALLSIADGDYYKRLVFVFRKIKKALLLSLKLNDKTLIEQTKKILMAFENRHSNDTKPGLWGYSFDLLIDENKVDITSNEESDIINELEAKLKRLTTPDSDNFKIDPWAAEAAALRLGKYYKKKNKNEEMSRVILNAGNAFLQVTNDGSPLQASSWIDHVYKLYKQFNLHGEAEQILIKLREIGSKVKDEMKSIHHTFELPKEEVEQYINETINGDIDEVLAKIAIRYIPNKEQIKQQMFELQKQAPTMFIIGQQLLGDKGRIVASVGSLDTDLEGHIIRQVSQNLSLSSIFLRLLIKNAIEQKPISKNDILSYLGKSPVFHTDKIPFIEKSLDAYFLNDHLTFIHILLPQIEDILRNLLEISGGNILKDSKRSYGGFDLRTFGDILRDEKIEQMLGQDFIYYLKVLFIDQRGWNMRNNVCHGISNINLFNQKTSDRLLHVLLCLGLIREHK